jgi:pullulanase/glycogen debranching enzyme
MILMGDEGGRTQRGNNNTYCHDNELSWLDWDRLAEHADLCASPARSPRSGTRTPSSATAGT